MKLSDFVVDFIAALGVRHVFMVPGGGAMHLNDSLGRHRHLKYICNLHEQGSAIAAETYGQFAGLGVAMVTTGPGGTNAVTGVAGAWLESTPMLVISGQVKRADLVGNRAVRQIGFQEIDIVQIVKPITKFAVTVLDPKYIRASLEEALWHATHGRKGPVWVDIPLDVQGADIDTDNLPHYTATATEDKTQQIREAAQRTAALLAEAKRPVVLVGNGVRHAGAVDVFIKWAELIQIPILTTWKAIDFVPDTHPLYVGRPGAVGQRAANFAQQTSDLLICIGARLDFGQTAYNHHHFAPRAKRIVVDIDPAEISKLTMSLAVAATCDAGAFLQTLIDESRILKTPDWSAWRNHCTTLKARFPIVLPHYYKVESGVHNYVFVDELGRALKDGDLLVPGSSGACSEVTCQAMPVTKKIRFINTQGLGSMGFGVPAALGACLAAGGRRTICIDGDGGFAMNSQELAVIAHLNLPIKIFVLNNNGYGSIRTTQINYFSRRFVGCDAESGLALPSIEGTAAANSVSFRKIDSQEDLGAQIRHILSLPGPSVCEVVMAPDQLTQPKVSSKQQADGKMATMPMEDLWPFLDRDVFDEAMTGGGGCDTN